MSLRIFATCDIGEEALDRLRQKGWSLEVYERIEPPPKALILEKVKGGVDALTEFFLGQALGYLSILTMFSIVFGYSS